MNTIAQWFKNRLKFYFLILKVRNRFSAAVQIQQRQLFHYYKDKATKNETIPLSETGYRVFSQFEEDGKLLYIFSVIGMTNKTFIEIGSDDGVNSNSANLYFNFAWSGLFIDANPTSIKRGINFFKKYPHNWFYTPKFVCKNVTKNNINQIILEQGYKEDIGLLSIDIDGNDYWIWDAINCIDPQVVIIECNVIYGLNNIVVPYNEDDNYSELSMYSGASAVAITKLAKQKGYSLVAANHLGINLIFVKSSDISNLLPEISVKSILTHPSVAEKTKHFETIKNLEYITP